MFRLSYQINRKRVYIHLHTSNQTHMEKLKSFPRLALVFSLVSTVMMIQVNSQSSTICSGAMTRSFSPCLNYLTSSSSSASSPTEACCTSLKNLMSNGQDCLCLIVTGGVPFQIPFNRALALSLPRACKMVGVPVECKATSSPISAPDPGEGDRNMPPLSYPPSPRAASIQELPPPSLPPESDVLPSLTPPGMRPTLFPSAANSCHSALPSFFAILGVCLFNFSLIDIHLM